MSEWQSSEHLGGGVGTRKLNRTGRSGQFQEGKTADILKFGVPDFPVRFEIGLGEKVGDFMLTCMAIPWKYELRKELPGFGNTGTAIQPTLWHYSVVASRLCSTKPRYSSTNTLRYSTTAL